MTKEELHKIYLRHSNRIYRFCFVYLKNEQDALDGVQEIFVRLWQQQVTFKDEAHEEGWLILSAKRYCIDVLKSSWVRKRGKFPEWQEADYKKNLEKSVQDRESALELRNQVMKLPVKIRETMFLYYYEEYSVREIGQILEVKESTIQSRLASGRKKLKKLVKEANLYENESMD